MRRLVGRLRYRGAVWDCGLVQNDKRVGIHFLRITLTQEWIRRPARTLLSVPTLRMFRVHSDVNLVRGFIDYCLSTRRAFEVSQQLPPIEPGFAVGRTVLRCFGNFMDTQPRLIPSKDGGGRGIREEAQWPSFLVEYAIHDSATLPLPQDLRLMAHAPPFSTVYEAYEHYFYIGAGPHMDHRIQFVFPIRIARLRSVQQDGERLAVALERALPTFRSLRLAVLARSAAGARYRRQGRVTADHVTHTLGFAPASYEVALFAGALEIDRLESQQSVASSWEQFALPSTDDEDDTRRTIASGQTRLSYDGLFPATLTDQQSPVIRRCLEEVEGCGRAGLWIAAAVMLRKTLDLGVIEAMRVAGREGELYTAQGQEKRLAERLDLLGSLKPSIRRQQKDLLEIKWFGDKGAHSSMDIVEADVRRIALKLRAFLTELAPPLSA